MTVTLVDVLWCSQQHGTNIDEREEKVMTIDQESRQLQQVSVTYEQQRGTLVYEWIFISYRRVSSLIIV